VDQSSHLFKSGEFPPTVATNAERGQTPLIFVNELSLKSLCNGETSNFPTDIQPFIYSYTDGVVETASGGSDDNVTGTKLQENVDFNIEVIPSAERLEKYYHNSVSTVDGVKYLHTSLIFLAFRSDV
jgi:hypothetical protein